MEKLGKILVSKQEICFFISLLLLYENKVKLNFQYSLDHMRHILPMLKPCENGKRAATADLYILFFYEVNN